MHSLFFIFLCTYHNVIYLFMFRDRYDDRRGGGRSRSRSPRRDYGRDRDRDYDHGRDRDYGKGIPLSLLYIIIISCSFILYRQCF